MTDSGETLPDAQAALDRSIIEQMPIDDAARFERDAITDVEDLPQRDLADPITGLRGIGADVWRGDQIGQAP